MVAVYQKPKVETLFRNSLPFTSRLACSGVFTLDQSACFSGGQVVELENCQFSACVPSDTPPPPIGTTAIFQCEEDSGPFTLEFAAFECVDDNCDGDGGSTCTVTFEINPTPPSTCTVTSIIQNGQEQCGGSVSNEVVF